jgi:hypothetical protein
MARVSALVFEELETPAPPDMRLVRDGLVSGVVETGKRIVSEDYTRLNVACQRDGTAVLPRAWDHLEV